MNVAHCPEPNERLCGNNPIGIALPQSNAAPVSHGEFTIFCACPVHVSYLLSHRCRAAI